MIDRLGFFEKPYVTVLCYHSISNNGWRFSTTPEDFQKHMTHLKKNYDVISPDELMAYIKGTYSLKRPAALLTFDDGYKNIMSISALLLKHNISPIVFVLADRNHANREDLNNSLDLLSDDDIKKLINDGWIIGSHSATHLDLTSLDEIALKKEIYNAKATTEKNTRSAVECFAYPHGKYTPKIIEHVKKAQYSMAFSMDDKIVSNKTNVYAISRVGIDGSHSLAEFKITIKPIAMQFRKFVRKTLKIAI